MSILYDKVLGCLAGATIGSAMGAQVEGWSREKIKNTYGILTDLLPYGKVPVKEGASTRPAGTTEDGVERIRLMCTAIIEKGGRITANDLAKVWIRDINPKSFGILMQPCDEPMYKAVVAGFPPSEAGRHSNFLGINSFGRACHAIGIINACNPRQAIQDAYEIGQMYQAPHGYGMDYGAAVCGAIAEAMKPNATVDSVVQVAIDTLPEGDLDQWPKKELLWALELAEKASDVWDMRDRFYERYTGEGTPYYMAWAQEVVTKAFAIFYKTNGDFYDALIAGVNFGRDTDCVAAIAAGLAGAYEGTKNIKEEWITTVDAATLENDYTVSKRLLRPTAEGMVAAIINEMQQSHQVLECLGQQL